MNALWLFFMVCLVSTATPGPSVLYVTSQGMAGGFRSALGASYGILAADALYLMLSITGLSTILLASYGLFTLIKWIGAVYLVYFGMRLFLTGLLPSSSSVPAAKPADSPRKALLGGFILHASNPKALLYFSALVPQFVDTTSKLGAQLLCLILIHLATAGTVLLVYSFLAARFRHTAPAMRIRRAFNALAGMFLIGAGVSLALSHKTGR